MIIPPRGRDLTLDWRTILWKMKETVSLMDSGPTIDEDGLPGDHSRRR